MNKEKEVMSDARYILRPETNFQTNVLTNFLINFCQFWYFQPAKTHGRGGRKNRLFVLNVANEKLAKLTSPSMSLASAWCGYAEALDLLKWVALLKSFDWLCRTSIR